jgi:UDP-N-acetylglucosamine:LPS N-acetylglucosamine transferase
MPRVLIPYFSAGFGHMAVAHAVEHGLRGRGADVQTRLVDLGAELGVKALDGLYVGSWQGMLRLPRWVQTVLYALNGVFPWGFGLANERAMRLSLDAASALLHSEKPDAIVSTHWGCCHLLNRARGREGITVPLYYVYTELAGAYRPLNCGADTYFCMTDDAGAALVRVGVPPDRVVPIGLVVRPELCGDLPPRAEARRTFGLREDRLTVLFSLGGEGIGRVIPFLDHYLAHGRSAQILVLAGRNARLLATLGQRYPPRADGLRVVPVGVLPSPREALAAADLVAGKCGTSFAMEAIVAGRPLLVTQVGAPNEATNRDFMVRHGYAVRAGRPADFTAAVERMAAAGVGKAGEAVHRATGADEVAAYVCRRLSAIPRRGERIR